MKFICKDEKEYKALMELSVYLHDFTVEVKDKPKYCKIDFIKKWGHFGPDGNEPVSERVHERNFGYCLDLNDMPLLNILAHLHSEDCDQSEYIGIEGKKEGKHYDVFWEEKEKD